MRIPTKFKLFATTIDVLWDEARMSYKGRFGESDNSTSAITLTEKLNGQPVSDDVKLDTFYHERTHAILDAMGEYELSANEKFVEIFSRLLRQSEETSEYTEQ